MSRDGGGRTGRHVRPDEAELWSHATRSLARVKAKPRVTTHAADLAATPLRSAGADAGRARPRLPAPPKTVPPPPAAAPRRIAPLAGFDRRALRQVAAGKVAIDARLDLHGLQRGDAHARLLAFLRDSRAKGHRMLLVITGKGGEAETGDHLGRMLGRRERGVLRRSVPQWLEEPELRAVVLGYTEAGPRHGGDGALYVRLRKARET
jgi:DNA-nicking Smr family endonuclease